MSPSAEGETPGKPGGCGRKPSVPFETMKNNKIEISVAVHGNQWRKVQARLVPDLGPTPVAVHRTLNRPGWSLTAVLCGQVIARGPTQQACLRNYQTILSKRSPDEILARVSNASLAPAPGGLDLVEKPQSREPQRWNAAQVADAITARAALTPDEREAVLRALSKAGPNTGRLLKNPPVGYRDALASAAWNGIQPNPYKLQLSCVAFARGPEKVLLEKLLAKSWPVWLDADASALVDLGVW